MSETMEYVNCLASEIGPRPAGTEEERQAAEFIAEELESSSGLPVEIEDFSAPSGNDAPRAICAGIAVVGGVLSLLLPIFGIPAVILLLIATALTVAEYLDKPLILKALSRGASQNVVAKYDPGMQEASSRGRARKVVVVAHYDSGKVRNELSSGLVKILPGLQKASFWAVPALFVFVLIRSLFLSADTGFLGVLFTVLVFVGVVLCLIPLVFALLHKISPYNEAANSNAAGVAVMMEVAGRVGRGRMTEEEIEHLRQYDNVEAGESADEYEPVVHGEQEAYAAGVVPDGAALHYETEPTVEEPAFLETLQAADLAYEQAEEQAEEEPVDGLSAAKAAIAALTGVPVASTVAAAAPAMAAEAPVEAPVEVAEAVEEAADEIADAPTFAFETAQRSTPTVPDWFAAAQARAKANKPDADVTAPIKRSRYADALDAAVSESSVHFNSANRQALTGMDEQIARLNDGIVEVKAPGFEEEPVASAFTPRVVTASAEPVVPVEQPLEATPDVDAEPVESLAAEPAPAAAPSFLDAARDEEGVDDFIALESAKEEAAVPAFASVPSSEDYEQEYVEPVSDFVGNIANEFEAQQEDSPSLSKKLPVVVLADTTGAFAAVAEGQKQRAPLADSSSTAKSLLSMLPSIDPVETAQESAPASVASLRATLPSLSGTISATPIASSTSGSAGATGVFAPVTEEIVKAASPEEDLFIEDADDSDYQENFTESGAFAGPDYVEMPKSPVRSFFDKLFHRKDDKEVVYYDDQSGWGDEEYDDGYEDEWVDEGQEYGDEDFLDDALGEYDDEYVDGDDRWNGGALSALKNAAGSVGDKVRAPKQKESRTQPAEARTSRRGSFANISPDEGVSYSEAPRERFDEQPVDGFVSEEGFEPDAQQEGEVPATRAQVETFRNPFVSTEVWFVALGSDLAGNAGMRAFVEAHSAELRGAIIVELDALGAGKLSLVETEGTLKKAVTSSRMKRYLRKVSQATGVTCANVHFDWNDSAASYANTHGLKAMHLVGEQGGKPAYFAQDNDTIDVVEEQALETNVECVMELLRVI